jgi:dephospho-CoA kinase
LLAHGGILRYLMEHAHCLLQDERTHNPDKIIDDDNDVRRRPISERFGNCELRRYRLECHDDDKIISLTEIDLVS